MASILSNLRNTIISGFVLTLVLLIVVAVWHGEGAQLGDLAWWSFFFRWGAMWTIVTGLILAALNGYLWDAIAIGLTDGVAKHTQIGIGMWLGAIMWFNVWFIIWPNQKIALGIDGAEGDKPKAGRTAMLFSRTNTMLSIPMLYAMTSAQNIF